MSVEQIAMIPTSKIHPPTLLIRQPHRTSLRYMLLRDSIERFGILSSLAVKVSERFPGDYDLIAGMHRYFVAKELDIREIPCIIKEVACDATELMILQFQENAQRVEMPPLEAARFIKEVMVSHPDITIHGLSALLCVNEAWIKKVLKLDHAIPAVIEAVRDESLPFESAVLISRLPDDLQLECLEYAIPQASDVFRRWFRKYWASLRSALYTNRMAKVEMGKPRAHLRFAKEIYSEHGSNKVGQAYCDFKENIGWKKALAWVLHLDPYSVERQRNRFQHDQEIRLLTKHERKKARQALREKQASIPISRS